MKGPRNSNPIPNQPFSSTFKPVLKETHQQSPLEEVVKLEENTNPTEPVVEEIQSHVEPDSQVDSVEPKKTRKRRAKDKEGRFIGDNPETPEDEAWVFIEQDDYPSEEPAQPPVA